MTKIERQQSLFAWLKELLGEASSADVAALLALREVVNCEPELTIETINSLNEHLSRRKTSAKG